MDWYWTSRGESKKRNKPLWKSPRNPQVLHTTSLEQFPFNIIKRVKFWTKIMLTSCASKFWQWSSASIALFFILLISLVKMVLFPMPCSLHSATLFSLPRSAWPLTKLTATSAQCVELSRRFFDWRFGLAFLCFEHRRQPGFSFWLVTIRRRIYQ